MAKEKLTENVDFNFIHFVFSFTVIEGFSINFLFNAVKQSLQVHSGDGYHFHHKYFSARSGCNTAGLNKSFVFI